MTNITSNLLVVIYTIQKTAGPCMCEIELRDASQSVNFFINKT